MVKIVNRKCDDIVIGLHFFFCVGGRTSWIKANSLQWNGFYFLQVDSKLHVYDLILLQFVRIPW